MSIWEEVGQGGEAAAAGPEPAPASIWGELEDQRPVTDEDLGARVKSLFDASLTRDPDAHAQVLEVARQTRLPTGLVESQLPTIQQAWKKSQFDGVRFVKENRDLTHLILEHRELAPVALDDSALKGFFDRFGARYRRTAKGIDVNYLGSDLLAAEARGEDTYELEKRLLDAQLEASASQLPEGRNAVENVVLKAADILPSNVEVLKRSAAGAAVGAGAGAGLGALAGGVGAVPGAITGALWGGRTEAFLASYDLERGGAYLAFREMKLDDGRPMPREVARGAAMAYGVLAAAVEVAALGPVMRMFGPVGDMIARGEKGAAIRALLADRTFRSLAKDLGKRWIEGAGSEAAEEVTQNLLQDVIGWAARSWTAGAPQAADPVASLEDAAQVGLDTFEGMLVTGLPGMVTNVATQQIQIERAERAGEKIAALAGLKDSATARAAPEAIAKAAQRNGIGDAVYVDPAAMLTLFQGENPDQATVDRAATELLGEDGPAKLQEALATGEKVEVPLSTYLETWGRKGVAEALVEDTTTRRDQLTPRQAREARAALDKAVGELEAEAKRIETEQATLGEQDKNLKAGESQLEAETYARLAGAVQEQLVAAGRSKDEAKRAGALVRAYVRAMSKAFNQPAYVVFQDLGLDVRKGDTATMAQAVGAARPPGSMELSSAIAERDAVENELLAFNRQHGLESDPFSQMVDAAAAERIGTEEVSRRNSLIDRLEAANRRVRSAGERASAPKKGETFAQEERGFTQFEQRGFERIAHVILGPQADASTMAHELAHVMLEFTGDLAERFDAPDAVKAQYAEALKWLGVDKREDLKTEQHERWARAFEAYLFEGKAPSRKLEGIFQRFSMWLRQVYRSIASLGVELDPEIRGVFDRLLATEDELARARERAGLTRPMYRTPEEAGVTVQQWEEFIREQEKAHSSQARAMEAAAAEERAREAAAWEKETRAKLEGEAEQQFDALPASQAWRFLRKADPGENPVLRAILDGVRKRAARKRVEVPPEVQQRLDAIAEQVKGLEVERRLKHTAAAIAEKNAVPLDAAEREARRRLEGDAKEPIRLRSLVVQAHVVVRPTGKGGVDVVRSFTGDELAAGEEVRAVTLPTWLAPEEYSAAPSLWDWTWAALDRRKKDSKKTKAEFFDPGFDRNPQAEPEAVQRLVAELLSNGEQVKALGLARLVTHRGRSSEFRQALLDQLNTWLKTPAAARKYGDPFSPRQWGFVMRPVMGDVARKWDIHTAHVLDVSAPKWMDAKATAPEAVPGERFADNTERELASLRAEQTALNGQLAEAAADAVRPKLDLAEVLKYVGEKAAAVKLRGVTAPSGGIALEDLADALGAESPKELIDALVNHPAREAWVADRAKELLEERHPELVDETKRLREAAERAVSGEATVESILKELEILDLRKTKTADPAAAAARQAAVSAAQKAAAALVDQERIGNLRAQDALDAAMADAHAAAIAAAERDEGKAKAHKLRQLLNLFRFKELDQAKQDRDLLEKTAGQMSKPTARAKLGKGHPALRDAADRILEGFGFKEVEAHEKPLASLADAVQVMESEGAEAAFDPAELQELLDRRVDWRDLTVAQARQVLDALKNLRGVAANKGTVIVDGVREDREQTIQALLGEGARTMPDKGLGRSSSIAESWWDRLRAKWSAFDAAFTRTSEFMDMLGGGDASSLWYRVVVKAFRHADAVEAELVDGPVKKINEALEALPESSKRKLWEPIDGRKLFPTHNQNAPAPSRYGELLVLLLNAGNAENLQRLRDGRGITVEQLMAAFEVLTREEREWAQTVWDAFESMRPVAFALEERFAGVAPPKVEARPLIFADGLELRGGYFPAVYDPRSGVGQAQAEAVVGGLMDRTFTRPGTQRSHLKRRAKEVKKPISLEFGTIGRHLFQVAHDVAYREAVQSVGSIVMDDRVRSLLISRLGKERADEILPWVKSVGTMRGADGAQSAAGLEKVLKGLKQNAAVSILGYSVPVALGDAANLAVGLTIVKPSHWAAGLGEFMRQPKDAIAWTGEKSDALKARRARLTHELGATLRKLTSKHPAVQTFKDHAFEMFEWTDLATSTPIWIGAYRQALAEGKADAAAVAEADRKLLQVFPSRSATDLSAALRNKGFVGSSLAFYGYLNTMWTRSRALAHDLYLGFNQGGVIEAGMRLPRVTGRLMALWVTYSVVGELLTGRGPEDGDGEDKLTRWRNWFLRKLLLAPAYAMPWGIGGLIESMVLNRRPSIRAAPAFAAGEAVLRATQNALDGDVGAQDAWAALRAIGAVGGIPLAGPMRPAEYVTRVATGNADVRGPLDVAGGVLYGDRAGNPLTLTQDAISGE